MKGKKTYFASRNVIQLPHYLAANKQLFIRPSLTPKQIAENTSAYEALHAEASHYPFRITSPIPTPHHKHLLRQQKMAKAKLEQTHFSGRRERAERGPMFAQRAPRTGHPTSHTCVSVPKT